MTEKVITYTQADGQVVIVIPTPQSHRHGEPEHAWLARVAARAVPKDATNVQVMNRADIPQDRTFRSAWRCGSGRLSVDMHAAREIWRNRLRKARKPLLAALDAEYQRADEAGNARLKAEIAKRKQSLRDCTKAPEIEAAASLEDLRQVWPL